MKFYENTTNKNIFTCSDIKGTNKIFSVVGNGLLKPYTMCPKSTLPVLVCCTCIMLYFQFDSFLSITAMCLRCISTIHYLIQIY